MKQLIGLAGAHRVGKTTLAKAYAKSVGVEFAQTSVSDSLKRAGFDARSSLTLSERLYAQEIALEDCIALYERSESGSIVDRTPLDLAAYTLSEVTMHRAVNLAEDVNLDRRFEAYIGRCIRAALVYFSDLVVVCPGIGLTDAAKSAAPSIAYIDNIHYTVMGLATSVHAVILPDRITNLQNRVDWLKTNTTKDNYLNQHNYLNKLGRVMR